MKISPERVIKTALTVSITGIIINAVVSILTGSRIILAGLLQELSDLISMTFVYLGIRSSRKKLSKKHPFGYGKILYLWVFIAGIITFFLNAGLTIYLGIERIIKPVVITNLLLAYTVLILSLALNGYSVSLSIRRLLKGRKLKDLLKRYNETSMIETKTIFTLDIIGFLSASAGVITMTAYIITGNSQFDGIGSLMIGLILALLTLFLLRSAKELIIGSKASNRIENLIKEAALKVNGVKEVLDLKTMNIGLGSILAIIEIHANPNLMTKQIEKLTDKVKESIKNEVIAVKQVQVEIETP